MQNGLLEVLDQNFLKVQGLFKTIIMFTGIDDDCDDEVLDFS